MSKSLTLLAEELLTLLKENRGVFHPSGILASKLQVNLETLAKATAELKSWGYKLGQSKRKGLCLQEVPDLLLPMEIKDGLMTKIMGREIHSYQSLGSTNQVAFHLAEAGAPQGGIVIAERQTAGRGRLSRRWHSPPKLGIWLSIILRPAIPLSSVPALSLCAGLACLRTTQALTGKFGQIKWPNDAYLNDKKFSGVLTELSAELDKVNFVILGIGININHKKKDFPANLQRIATSLRIETKNLVSRTGFLQRFLKEFEKIYQEYSISGLAQLKPEIMQHFYLLNRQVKIAVGDKEFQGRVKDIDPYGALVLETEDGLKMITAGDVHLSLATLFNYIEGILAVYSMRFGSGYLAESFFMNWSKQISKSLGE